MTTYKVDIIVENATQVNEVMGIDGVDSVANFFLHTSTQVHGVITK